MKTDITSPIAFQSWKPEPFNASTISAAMLVAHRWLAGHPRPLWHKVTAFSSEDDIDCDAYFHFSPSDLAIIKAWSTAPDDKRNYLSYYLEAEGHTALKEYLEGEFERAFLYSPIVESCDLAEPICFTEFSCTALNPDGTHTEGVFNIDLTDEEYCQILAACIIEKDMTFNHLSCDYPDLASRITNRAERVAPDFGRHPFIISLSEFTAAANAIMDPHTDVLGLFSVPAMSKNVKELLDCSARTPFDSPAILFEDYDKDSALNYVVYFRGKKLIVEHNTCDYGYDGDKNDNTTLELDADKLCMLLSSPDYDCVAEYIVDNFSGPDAITRIKEWLTTAMPEAILKHTI